MSSDAAESRNDAFTSTNLTCLLSSSVLPVTALCFISETDLLLAGRGGCLNLYGHDNVDLCSQQLFDFQAIHGIVCGSFFEGTTVVLCWGGRKICAVAIDIRNSDSASHDKIVEFRTSRAVTCSDWIVDCAFAPQKGQGGSNNLQASAITAHNALIVIELTLVSGPQDEILKPSLKLTSLTKPTRCLLYSAHIRWVGSDEVLVAAGTAFGIAHGHGSIFDICTFGWSHSRELPGSDVVLATCSDDRTIKVWQVTSGTTPKVTQVVPLGALNEPELEVGQGGHDPANPARLLASVPPGDPKTREGHISRIWRLRLLPSDRSNEVFMASFGEDATCQTWCLQREESPQKPMPYIATIRHCATSSLHAGKSIWAAATSSDGFSKSLIATGGADGRICRSAFQHSGISMSEQHAPTQKQNVSRLNHSDKEFCQSTSPIKVFAFIDDHKIIAASADGSVLVGTIEHDDSSPRAMQPIEWRALSRSKHLQGYAVTSSIPSLGIGFVGGLTGEVTFMRQGQISQLDVPNLDGKIGSLFAQAISKTAIHEDVDCVLLVTALGATQATLLLMHTASDTTIISTRVISLNPEFVVTSMLYVSNYVQHDALYLGSRDGRVTQYTLIHAAQNDSSSTALRAAAVSAYHKDAVTSLAWEKVDPGHEYDQGGAVLSTSRDGTYAVAVRGQDNAQQQLAAFHQSSLPFGPYIEGYFRSDGSLCFYGFQSEDFVVYNETQKDELWRIRCGGAHRMWAFEPPSAASPDASDRGACFVWNQASTVHIATSSLNSHVNVEQGGHGREIKACAVSDKMLDTNGTSAAVIATGGEDTDIRLWLWKGDKLRCTNIIRQHNTGLQQLQWSSDGRYLFSCGGREEFFIWRISVMPFVTLGVACVAKLPVKSKVSDLRIMGFDVSEYQEEEGRYMITMALSNSSIRAYSCILDPTICLTTSDNSLQPVASITPSDHCLMAIRYFSTDSETRPAKALAVATGGTNGKLEFWALRCNAGEHDDQMRLEPLFCSRLHQSSMKAMTIVQLPRSDLDREAFLVISVGDDNAISITTTYAGAIASLLVPNAHAASITAVQVLAGMIRYSRDATFQEVILATAGNDQKLKIWKIDLDLGNPGTSGIQVKLLRSMRSAVADVSSLALLPSDAPKYSDDDIRTLLICGVGTEFWRIPVLKWLTTGPSPKERPYDSTTSDH